MWGADYEADKCSIHRTLEMQAFQSKLVHMKTVVQTDDRVMTHKCHKFGDNNSPRLLCTTNTSPGRLNTQHVRQCSVRIVQQIIAGGTSEGVMRIATLRFHFL